MSTSLFFKSKIAYPLANYSRVNPDRLLSKLTDVRHVVELVNVLILILNLSNMKKVVMFNGEAINLEYAPEESSVVGEIVKIDYVPEALRIQLNSDSTVVTVQDFEGVNHPMWFSDNQIAEFGLKGILFVGNVVSADVEHRIADTTEYVTQAGEIELHQSTALGGRNCTHASKIILLSKGLGMDFCKAMDELRAANAVTATPLSGRNVNFNRINDAAAESLPSIIAELKLKRDRSADVLKPQFDKKIAELEAKLPKEPETTLDPESAIAGGTEAGKGKGK